MSHITINDLIEYDDKRLGLTLLAGKECIKGTMGSPIIQIFNPSESALGEKIKGETILIIPKANIPCEEESSFDRTLNFTDRSDATGVSLIILTETGDAPDSLLQLSEEWGIPLACSENSSEVIRSGLMGILRRELERKVDIHGVLMDIFGIGVLIRGESGIGKSECGLELITRGHKLIADDAIEIEKTGETYLCGRSRELVKHFMEIRGLGIVDIKSLFGIAAVGDEIAVDIVVELIKWETGMDFSRIDSEERSIEIMGVQMPVIRVPVRSGGTMATVVEIVARNRILKMKGHSAWREMGARMHKAIKKEGKE